MNLQLSLAEVQGSPFPYALFDSVFPDATNRSLLTWLESTTLWTLAKTDFYEQYELGTDHASIPQAVQFLVDTAFKSILRTRMEQLFSVPLSTCVSALAHKLVPGQHIGIHNDLRHAGESHRFTVQLNRGLTDADGGYFMLFNSVDPSDIHRILKPVHNSALAFAISEQSHHAISKQYRGTRFTLVFSFFAANDQLT